MVWHAQLDLSYRLEAGRSVARHLHSGPLRILQSLYPEGDATCHNVLVHPPGGLVGGDTLDLAFSAAPGTHGLITTPGATRSVISARKLVSPARLVSFTQSSSRMPRFSASCGWISRRSCSCQITFAVRRVCAPTLY